MNSVPEAFQISLSNDGLAANADRFGQAPSLVAIVKSAAAWDPYEVWLRRIKEPRDRRSTDR